MATDIDVLIQPWRGHCFPLGINIGLKRGKRFENGLPAASNKFPAGTGPPGWAG